MNDLLPVGGNTRRYLNIAALLMIAAGTVTLLLQNQESPAPGQAAPKAQAHPGEPALFRVGEQTYGFAALPAEFQEPIYQIQKMAHEQQMLVLEQALLDAYIRQQMKTEGADREAVLSTLFPDAVPTEDAIRRFYLENRRADTPPLAKIEDQIKTHLTAQNRETMKQALLGQLLVKGEAAMLLEAPRPPRTQKAD
ncbi:hypothetical protein [Motiliproteus sp. SC1-56]|uniref:hypothetical protein n=1 Tax=Motiliproteus sp. SC1-56 TaxID=2799565 RepID=UPI001A8D5CE5|nr:hypothetical protein [Motiliproteus sp. SC1-56]